MRRLLHAPSALLRRAGKRAVVGVGLGVAAAAVFLEIADAVLEGETALVDRVGTELVRSVDAPLMDQVMRAITALGSYPVLAALVIAVALWALRRRRAVLAVVPIALGLGGLALNAVLKMLFARERPVGIDEIAPPGSFSFPSAHAMGAASVYGAIALVVAHLRPGWRVPAAVASIVLAVLVAVSRVYLGVHWPTDVVAGLAAGMILVLSGWLALHRFWDAESAPSGSERPRPPACAE